MRVGVLGTAGKVGLAMSAAAREAAELQLSAGPVEFVHRFGHRGCHRLHPSRRRHGQIDVYFLASADVAGTQTSLIFEHLRGGSATVGSLSAGDWIAEG